MRDARLVCAFGISVMLALVGCGDDDSPSPGRDAGAGLDSGARDGGGGTADAGPAEAGAHDAATEPDASGADAGGLDSGRLDAGTAPGDAAAPAASPECRFMGSRSEGWYLPDGTRVCWTFCSGGAAPTCEGVGTATEGWYTSGSAGCGGGRLIELADCG